MADRDTRAATNARIVQLLEELKEELADAKQREQQIARDLSRLLELRS